MPITPPPPRGGQGKDVEQFDPHVAPDRPVFRNIGTGPALNVWAVIFGPRPTVPSEMLPQRRTVIVGVPIQAGTEHDRDSAVGRTSLPGEVTLDGNPEHTLYAPPEPTQGDVMLRDTMRILARYTITCEDIFGRKHMGIFDFDFLHQWRCLGFFPIPKSLEEVNRERYIARMEAVTNPTRLPPPADL